MAHSQRYMQSPRTVSMTHDLGPADGRDAIPLDKCDLETPLTENQTTRLVLKLGTFPAEKTTQGINISGHLCHLKRSPNNSKERWQDVSHFDRRRLAAGEYVKIKLGPTKLKALCQTLLTHYRDLGGLELVAGEIGLRVVDPDTVTILEGAERETLRLLRERDPAFWENVIALDTSNMLELRLAQKRQRRRRMALREFKSHMEANDWDEREWEGFFSRNEWIFGLGLTYHYLDLITNQARLGGMDVYGSGTDIVDYLMKTSGDTRFSVLVDIKRPDTRLLHPKEYRSAIYRVDRELAGGVAQLQSYCHVWQSEGSRMQQNLTARIGAHTYAPKAILVAGSLSQLENDDNRIKSFELFRRNIHNPQILTFDEIYDRAKHMVTHYESDLDDEEASQIPF